MNEDAQEDYVGQLRRAELAYYDFSRRVGQAASDFKDGLYSSLFTTVMPPYAHLSHYGTASTSGHAPTPTP